jgi:hypothetical protein
VGQAALDRMATHPADTVTSFKRMIGTASTVTLAGTTLTPEDLSAMVLRSLADDVEAATGERPTEAVITVPAYFNERQRRATRRAGEIAGLEVRRLINEPTAAALAFGLADRGDREPFLVFDLGGGTFDVSIVEMFEGIVEVRAWAGDNRLGGMFDKMLGPFIAMGEGSAEEAVRKGIAMKPADIGLTEEQAAEVAAVLDPAYAERHSREMATVMEPAMRKAMSELYAINFSPKELDDIEAFFLTDSGAAYARKSFTISSDPRLVSATMEIMPQMMGAIADIEAKIDAATADLPPKRSFADLTRAEKAKISKLTGLSVGEIEEMAAANTEVAVDAATEAAID